MSRLQSIWFHAWRFFVLIVVIAGVTGLGLWVRDLAWVKTFDQRFNFDVSNGYRWGQRAYREGYFGLYERLGTLEDEERARIDYAPLRLGVMTLWANWVNEKYPGASPYERLPNEEFHTPVLMLNTAMELLASIAAGMLTYHLIRWRILVYSGWSGVVQGIIGGSTLWFNPVVICNAHMWPQWDIWPMPFFLFAVILCMKKYWLPAGILIGVGALLKGQMLLVAWIIPIWALVIGDWRGAIKVIVGVLTGFALVGIPWEISRYNPDTQTANFDLWSRSFSKQGIAHVVFTTLISIVLPLIFWKQLGRFRQMYLTLVCFVLSSSLFYSMYIGGSELWLRYSFEVGMRHHPRFYLGHPSNLASLLVVNYGWYHGDIDYPVDFVSRWLGREVSIRTLLLTIYIAIATFCAIMAGVNYRRRDPRMILAIILPWILFYTLILQIHERYLLYGSACCAVLLACGRGWYLLGWVFTFIGLLPTVHTLFNQPYGQSTAFTQYAAMLVQGTFPGVAWMLLMSCVVALFGILPFGQSKARDKSAMLPALCERSSST